MIKKLSFLSIILSITLMSYMFYSYQYVDQSKSWVNYQKPQKAAHSSLERDQSILKELDRLTIHKSHKVLDPSFFTKPNIFSPIKN